MPVVDAAARALKVGFNLAGAHSRIRQCETKLARDAA
jgi:hypothetical protein